MLITKIGFQSLINTRKAESTSFRGENLLLQSRNLPENGVDCFVRQNSLDIARLKALDIPHFRLIDSNSVRGMCLANKPITVFQELKEAGIKTVIDLRKEGSNDSKYAKTCQRFGLDYFNFKVKENMAVFNLPATTKLTSAEFKDMMDGFTKQLGHFFGLMDEGKVYMGCLLGLHRTDLAVVMNYLLNPKEPQSPPVLSHMFIKEETNFTNKRIGSIKNLIKNLKPEHIKELGLSENFKEIFDMRVTKLRMMNNLLLR